MCGQLQTRTYEGNDGSKRYSTEIVADDVEFIGSRAAQSGDESVPAAPAQNRGGNKKVSELKPIETDEDDFPF